MINFGELTKPATVLVEKISEAVGGIFRPYQIKRLAAADAEAHYIQAKSDIEISELQRRAMRRFLVEEGQKQENIESITEKALPFVTSEAKPQDVEKDWIANFFDKSRLISDTEMQTLWSRLLAGEANSPGNFSKRTIDLLASMDKSEANLFQTLKTFSWDFDVLQPLVYDIRNEIYMNNGLNFYKLTQLDKAGLIAFESINGFQQMQIAPNFVASYFGKKYSIKQPTQSGGFSVGSAILTPAGFQLASISDAKPLPEFIDYTIAKWKTMGYEVELLAF